MSASYVLSNENATRTANNVIRKRNDYENYLKQLTARNAIIAEALAHDGTVEQSIRAALQGDASNDNDSSENNANSNTNDKYREELRDFESFLKEQRERVKGLAHIHAETSHHTTAFMNALDEIKSDIQTNNRTTQQNPHNDPDQDEKDVKLSPPDFEAILQTKIEFHSQTLASSSPPQTHPDTIKIHEKLRETIPQQAHGSGVDADDDDDELEIEESNAESSENYKCPITGLLMENPRRNSQCGHYYSLQGIRFHLQKKRACPVPGCRNQRVTMDQLEEDYEFELKIKRFQKRMETEKRMRLTQTEDVEEADLNGFQGTSGRPKDDDDDDVGNSAGFTVVQ